jgi:hypothetical protein
MEMVVNEISYSNYGPPFLFVCARVDYIWN